MKEIISFLVYLTAVFVGNFFYNLCFKKLNKVDLKLSLKNIIFMLIIAILVYINNVYVNIGIKTIVLFIVMCINFKVLFKLKMKRTIISYIMICLGLVILEILITNILSLSGILNSNQGAISLNAIKLGLSVILGMIEYLIYATPLINRFMRKLLFFFESETTFLNISYLLFIAFFSIGILNFENFTSKGTIKIIVILLFVFVLLFAIIIKSKMHEENLKQSNKRLVEYNEKYGKFLDEYKIYKHNIKHKLAGMKAFGNKKINALIDDLLEEETSFTMKNNNIYSVPKEIKGIVAERLYNSKISVIVDNKLKEDPFKNMSPKEFNHISESIGICLDNAVEASVETENPIVTLDLYEDKEYIYIKIGNTFSNNIDIDELGDKYYSTKNRGSGLGLFSLKQNKFIQDKISIINDIYYIELKIKKHADN